MKFLPTYFIYNASVSKQLTEHTTRITVSAKIAPTIKKKRISQCMFTAGKYSVRLTLQMFGL
jgi:hypothetical protein